MRKPTLTAMAVGLALAFGGPALAQQQGQQQQQQAQQKQRQQQAQQQKQKQQPQQQAQQRAEQRKGIITATGTVIDRGRLRTTTGEIHELVKLRAADGSILVVDLGQPGGQPMLRQGDQAVVSGRAARINNKPVVFARYVAEVQQVGRTGEQMQQQAGQRRQVGQFAGQRYLWEPQQFQRQQQAQQGQPGAEWVVITFTPIEALAAAQKRRADLFRSLDVNQDRQISQAEARRIGQIAANFQGLDRDRDRVVSWAEFAQVQVGDGSQAAMAQRQGGASAGGSAAAGGTQATRGQTITPAQQRRVERMTFGLLDDDRDGVISHFEARDLPELAKSFRQLDINNDGVLTRAEFGPGIAQALWSGGPGYAQAGTR